MASKRKTKKTSFEWNIEATKILIYLYEENECLYNNVDPDYTNRDKRLSVISNIAKMLSDTTGKECLVTDVRRKINSIRSQYHAEKLKITKCKESGVEYVPTVYWFPLLRFLDKKKKRPVSAQDPDGLLKKEVMDTVKRMSKRISNNVQAFQSSSDNEISTFCNFMNSELNSILNSSNHNILKKAQRNIQMCLFDIWDEINNDKLHEPVETSYIQTNYSDTSNPDMESDQICTDEDVSAKTASPLIKVKANQIYTVSTSTQKANGQIAYFVKKLNSDEN